MTVLMCEIRGFSRNSERLPPRVRDRSPDRVPDSDELHPARPARHARQVHRRCDPGVLERAARRSRPSRQRRARGARDDRADRRAEPHDAGPRGSDLAGRDRHRHRPQFGHVLRRQHGHQAAPVLFADRRYREHGLAARGADQAVPGADHRRRRPGRAAEGFALLELDRVRVVGREAAESVFALLGDEAVRGGPASRGWPGRTPRCSRLIGAALGQGGSGARRGPARIRGSRLSGLRELYLERIAALREQPPGEGWDGVYQATEK